MSKNSRLQQGIAHLAVVVVVAVALVGVLGYLGFNAYVKSNEKVANKDTSKTNEGALKADAAGAYSSICGAGYNLRHTENGNGFTLRNYKNPSNGRGCALVINNNWGTSSKLSVEAYVEAGQNRRHNTIARNAGTFKYYAGPVYYNHAVNTKVMGSKNSSSAYHTITSK